MGCCNRKILISESEKKHILSLYGLINEADEPVAPQSQTTTSALKFDKSVNFAPGYYRLKGPVTTKAGVTYNWDVDQTLNSDLEKIKAFHEQYIKNQKQVILIIGSKEKRPAQRAPRHLLARQQNRPQDEFARFEPLTQARQ